MYSVTTQVLSFQEGAERFKEVIDLEHSIPENLDTAWSSIEVSLPRVDGTSPPPPPVLFVRAEFSRVDDFLRQVGGRLGHMNLDANNLSYRLSFAVLGEVERGALFIPLWGAKFMQVGYEHQTIRMVFVGHEVVIDMRHHLTDEDLDDFIIGCQGAMISSGPNYHQYRAHHQIALDETAALGDGLTVPGQAIRQC